MSGGRSRRKKLVRSKRLCKTDSEVDSAELDSSQPPPLEVVNEAQAKVSQEEGADEHEVVLEQETQSEQTPFEPKQKLLALAAASTWRAAADMGDNNPKWKRVAVRAVQLQELDSTKVNGDSNNSHQSSPENIAPPPPGPWGDKVVENAAVHVDMGKVVGVLRATHKMDEEINDVNLEGESLSKVQARHLHHL